MSCCSLFAISYFLGLYVFLLLIDLYSSFEWLQLITVLSHPHQASFLAKVAKVRSNKLSRKRVLCIQNYALINGSHKKICRIQNRCRNINYILKLKTNNKTLEFYSGRAMLQKSMQPQMNRLIQGDTAVSKETVVKLLFICF